MDKAGGGDGIPGELLQIPEDNAARVLHSLHQQIWKRNMYTLLKSWKYEKNIMKKNILYL